MIDDEFEEGEVLGSSYERKCDDVIKELALNLYKNEIFTSLQVREQDVHLLSSIFMPLIFMDDLTRKALILNGAYCFYAEMKEAAPRLVNGYPMFFSMLYLDQNDTKRMLVKYEEIKEVLGNV